jgi:branched-chain amino acid transport system ATP-binding protein
LEAAEFEGGWKRPTFATDSIGLRSPVLRHEAGLAQRVRVDHVARQCGGRVSGDVENRDIFPKLTVHQNLQLGEKRGKKNPRWSYDDMYKLFPRLKERQHTEAGVMSGGEQQMLTLCRTLMGDPDLIMIDEPTEGLAPKIVELVAQYLKELKNRGVSVLLVEQKLTIALEISERCYVMGHGRIVFEGTPADLRANSYIRKEWLEV